MDTDAKFENQIRRAVCDESVSDLLLMCRTRSNKTELLSFKRNGKGLVHFAAIFGSVSLIERLMFLGIDVKTKTEGQSANENVLHLACKHGKIEVVTFLLRLVSDLSFRNAVVLHGDNYRNAFYYAAQSGNIEIVNILKDVGRMNLNEVFPTNKTVLLNLIEEDNIEAVKMLCQCGANVNIGHFEKRLHAIHFAAEKKDGGELLRLVLTHGAYVNKPWGNQQPLFIAVKHGLVKNAKVLLEAGANVHSKGTSAKMGLIGCFCLAALKCPSLIPEFLSKGANPNELHDRNGDSVLTLAIKNNAGNEAISALLKAGANLDNAFQDETAKHMFPDGYCRQHQVTGALKNHSDEQDLSLEDVLQSFMEFGIDVNHKSQSDACPLIVAVWLESLDMVRLLIEKGANVNIMDEHDDTPLTFALMNGLDEIVDILLVSNANVNPPACKSSNQNQNNKTLEDNFQKEPILTRIIRDEKTLSDNKKNKYVKLLLEHGADSNITDLGKTSPLMYAVGLRMEQTVENLLEHDADVNYVGKDNFTALHTYFVYVGGSRSRHLKQRNIPKKRQSDSILFMLLEAGGSTSMLTKFNELPIHLALKRESVSEAHLKDVNLLLEKCKTVDCLHINSLLKMATRFYNFEIIDKIIKLGADVNFKNEEGDTAFHAYMDCLDFDLKVVSTMLQHGAMVNILNDSMETPLTRYIMRGRREVQPEIVVFMLENGANVNICGDRMNSALMLAITNDIPEIVETLIKAKANINHIGENGNTALHLVLAKGKWDQYDSMETSSRVLHYSSMYPTARKSLFAIDARSNTNEIKNKGLETVKLLLHDRADVNVVNDHKQTPLYIMIKCHDRSSVNILLPIMLKGSNPNLGEAVPLVKAAKRNFDVATKLLLDQGAEIDRKNQHGDSALMATLKTPTSDQEVFSPRNDL
ncbi:Hypothetical predicted protein [Mytilus galloprovincialis]|uniref:Uncharacterized protein n=1 Tax=Mytilus galloprovincialis TaxID=29158 RepID=A0A8B6E574_MYTGA|nr:Hypothetical predicted protein [Mytilus galloprovincialis]